MCARERQRRRLPLRLGGCADVSQWAPASAAAAAHAGTRVVCPGFIAMCCAPCVSHLFVPLSKTLPSRSSATALGESEHADPCQPGTQGSPRPPCCLLQEYEKQTKPSTLSWKSLRLAPEERVAACMQKLPRLCAAGEAYWLRPRAEAAPDWDQRRALLWPVDRSRRRLFCPRGCGLFVRSQMVLLPKGPEVLDEYYIVCGNSYAVEK